MAFGKALEDGCIAGAGQNVVMTAHTSGWGPDRQRRLVDLFAENVRRYAAGMELMNVVNKAAGY